MASWLRCGRRIPAAKAADRDRLQSLLAELGDPRFEARERAEREVRQVGDAAEPAIREFLAGTPPAEARRRAERMLSDWDAARLRDDRVLELLEHLGTAEARTLLAEWAAGPAGLWRTDQAQAAVRRHTLPR